MDQKTYLSRVDHAVAEVKSDIMAFFDRGAAMIRLELEHQHGSRRPGGTGPADRLGLLTAMQRGRAARSAFMPAQLFADPVWDMLVELTIARLERRIVTVKVLQAAALVPGSTGLRWLKLMEQHGLIWREDDRLDHRCVNVALTDHGWRAMSSWLEMRLS